MTHIALLVVTSLAATPSPRAQDAATAVEDLSALLVPLLESRDVPALACALLEDGRLTGLGAAGVRRRGEDPPVTTDDLWHLGSCTKAMTATMIARLVERHELDWTTTMVEAFPDIEVHESLATVTLIDLLSHRAGIVRDPMQGDLWMRLVAHTGPLPEARDLVARRILPREPAFEPGAVMEYSNTGYMIAGAIAERVTGKAWEELMQREVFGPLGMTSAGFGAPGVPDELTQPRGHGPGGLPAEPGPLADNPAALGPAGTVHATLGDWARFVALHLAGAGGEPEGYLSADTIGLLHEPRGDAGEYALGWGVTERPWADGAVLTHAGSNLRWFSVVWAAPSEGLALLVACNQGGTPGQMACDEACVAMLRHRAEAGKGR